MRIICKAKPSPMLVYSNFNTYEWLDYHLARDFSGGSSQTSRPAISEFYSVTNNLNLSKDNRRTAYIESGKHSFSNVSGKGKLCSAAGLTGAEKRACKKNIKTTCGHKPLFGSAKKQKWAQCAQGAVVTPEQSAKETADSLIPSSNERDVTGLSTGAKVMIAVGAIGFVTLVGFAIANKNKAKQNMILQTVRK